MKLGIVLHITATNHWKEWLNFLIAELAISGLIKANLDIFATLKGAPADLTRLQNALNSINIPEKHIKYHLLPIDSCDITEYSSLKIIEALNNNSRYDYICYLHSKGVTYNRSIDPIKSYMVQEWALQMTNNILSDWQVHLERLRSDSELFIAGCNIETKPKLHFSGNTFWIKAKSPLNRLLMPHDLKKDSSDTKARWRLYYEFWVCENLRITNLVEAGRTHKEGLIGFHYSNWSE